MQFFRQLLRSQCTAFLGLFKYFTKHFSNFKTVHSKSLTFEKISLTSVYETSETSGKTLNLKILVWKIMQKSKNTKSEEQENEFQGSQCTSCFSIFDCFNSRLLRTTHKSQLSFENFLTSLMDSSKTFENKIWRLKIFNIKKECYSIKDEKNNFTKSGAEKKIFHFVKPLIET